MAIRHTKKEDNVNMELFDQIFTVNDLYNFENLYLFSSGMNEKDDELFNLLRLDLKNKLRMVLIIGDPDNEYSKNNEWALELTQYFKKIGLTEFITIDKETTKFAAIKHIESADIIFLMGGNPVKQLKLIKEKEIDYLIKDFKGIIMGLSAGSMNIGKTVYLSKDDENPESIIYEGLGIVDVTLDPHFNLNNEIQTKEFLETKINVIGLPDDSYIKIDKYGIKTFYGAYYTKENKKIVSKNEKRQ